MPRYLAKTYDSMGRLIGRTEFAASGDRQAFDIVRELREGRTCELWCGRRRVNTWRQPAVGLIAPLPLQRP